MQRLPSPSQDVLMHNSTFTLAAQTKMEQIEQKIDMHAHILPERWPSLVEKFGNGRWITLKHLNEFQAETGYRKSMMMYEESGQPFRAVDEKVYSLECRLREMSQTGVTHQVLSTVPVMFSYWAKAEHTEWVARHLNDHVASVCTRHPDRFTGLATVPLQSPELAIAELKRARYELGLKGVIIGTHVGDHSLDHPMFEPFWRAADQHSMALFLHPWDVSKANGRWNKFWLSYIVGMTAETTAAALSLALGGVLQRHRELRICLSHGGGALPYLSARANHAFRVYPHDMQQLVDQPPDHYLRQSSRIASDCLVHDPNAFRLALDYFGDDSLMLGSDYPFLLGEQHPGSLIDDLQLSPELRRKILSGNVLRFFQ